MNGLQIEETARIRIAPARPALVPIFPQISEFQRRTSRRQRKVLRFLVWEFAALSALVASLIGGTSAQLARQALTTPFVFGVLLAAAALVVIPVFFFALPSRRDNFRRDR